MMTMNTTHLRELLANITQDVLSYEEYTCAITELLADVTPVLDQHEADQKRIAELEEINRMLVRRLSKASLDNARLSAALTPPEAS